MYDFGSPNLNLEAYGSTVPPDYEPRRLRIPTAVYWAATDWLADRLDVEVRACCVYCMSTALYSLLNCTPVLRCAVHRLLGSRSGCCLSWRTRRCRRATRRVRRGPSRRCSTRSTSRATRTQTSFGHTTRPALSTRRSCNSSANTSEQRDAAQPPLTQHTRIRRQSAPNRVIDQ